MTGLSPQRMTPSSLHGFRTNYTPPAFDGAFQDPTSVHLPRGKQPSDVRHHEQEVSQAKDFMRPEGYLDTRRRVFYLTKAIKCGIYNIGDQKYA